MMAMEDLASDLNITMAEIEKWEKEGKVPAKAVKHLKFLEEDLGEFLRTDYVSIKKEQILPRLMFLKKTKAPRTKIL